MTMNLGDRMKRYEGVTKTALMPRTPAIIRVDGKAFHTWTKGLDRPFDTKFYIAMARTARLLVDNIQGAVFAYGQSDEISIFLKDYATLDTDAWFGGSVQKIASVSASMATAYFNSTAQELGMLNDDRGFALFDSRVFALPTHEVTNYYVWRQKDFMRNSVQMAARHYLGHGACQGLKRQDMIDAMRELESPFDWYRDLAAVYQRGFFYQRDLEKVSLDIPEFTECRDFIEVHVH
jgi:tRNA(His) guanylyltransferase